MAEPMPDWDLRGIKNRAAECNMKFIEHSDGIDAINDRIALIAELERLRKEVAELRAQIDDKPPHE